MVSSKFNCNTSVTFLFLLVLLSATSYHSTSATSETLSIDNDFGILESHLNSRKSPNFEDEYKLFMEELENGTAKQSGKSRQKRYVYLNTETNLDVGYLIVTPVTVVLPSMSNLFNNWRRKRSLDNFEVNSTSEEQNPVAQYQTDRISSYFELMNIPEKSCQLRAVCELSASPGSYFPLSDIILSKIREPTIITAEHQTSSHSSSKPSLLQLFRQAADEGISFGKEKCDNTYGKMCKYSFDKLINMPVMKFWNKLQSTLRLKFEDDTVDSIL